MNRPVIFSSLKELCWFLWGAPGEDHTKTNIYQTLIGLKSAWMQPRTPQNVTVLERWLVTLDGLIRKTFFYPPHDTAAASGLPRNLVVLFYHDTNNTSATEPYYCVCRVPVLSDEQTVVYLRTEIDRFYGAGFFDRNICSVRLVPDVDLLSKQSKQLTFGSCDSKTEVV